MLGPLNNLILKPLIQRIEVGAISRYLHYQVLILFRLLLGGAHLLRREDVELHLVALQIHQVALDHVRKPNSAQLVKAAIGIRQSAGMEAQVQDVAIDKEGVVHLGKRSSAWR